MTAVTVAVRLVGALDGGMVVCGSERFGAERVANVARYGPPSAMESALLDPVLELLEGRPLRVERHRRGLRDGVRVDGEDAGSCAEPSLDDCLFGRVVKAARMEDDPPTTVTAVSLRRLAFRDVVKSMAHEAMLSACQEDPVKAQRVREKRSTAARSS